MPPKRARKKPQPLAGTPPPLRPLFNAHFRAQETFTCQGIRFEKGALVSPNDELALEIYAEHPELLELVQPT